MVGIFLKYDEPSSRSGFAVRSIKDNRKTDLMAAAENGEQLPPQVDAPPHNSGRNMRIVPNKIAELHGLGNVEHAAHDLLPPSGQQNIRIVAGGITNSRFWVSGAKGI